MWLWGRGKEYCRLSKPSVVAGSVTPNSFRFRQTDESRVAGSQLLRCRSTLTSRRVKCQRVSCFIRPGVRLATCGGVL